MKKALRKSPNTPRLLAGSGACLALLCGAMPVAAEVIYTGNGSELQAAPDYSSGFGVIGVVGDGNKVTVDYVAGGSNADPSFIFGSVSQNGTASSNLVNFVSGLVTRDVYGGYATTSASVSSAFANNNTVNMSFGANLNGVLRGGYVELRSSGAAGTASHNTINYSANINTFVIGSNVDSFGNPPAKVTQIGNKVNVSNDVSSGAAVDVMVSFGIGAAANLFSLNTEANVSGNSVNVTLSGVATITSLRGASVTASSDNAVIMMTNNSVNFSKSSTGALPEIGAIGARFEALSTATNEKVTMSGNSVNFYDKSTSSLISNLIGADALFSTSAVSGQLSGNSVTVSAIVGGNVLGANLLGGNASSANFSVTDNSVTVLGGKIGGSVTGAYANVGDALSNTVDIKAGEISGDVLGGYAIAGNANNNTVTLGAGATLKSTSNIWGGKADSGSSLGNTLNVNGYKTGPLPTDSVASIQGFQTINVTMPSNIAKDAILLKVANPVNLMNTTVAMQGFDSGAPVLKVGESVQVISNTSNKNDPSFTFDGRGRQGSGIAYLFAQSAPDVYGVEVLGATLIGVAAAQEAKAAVEGVAAGLGFINQGADLASGEALRAALTSTNAAAAGASGLGFGAMIGGDMRLNTGSHIDARGVSFAVGYAAGIPMNQDKALAGIFLEGGNGNYDSYNSFASSTVKGSGDTSYMGGGILGRMDFASGLYAETSLRTGRAKTSFNSADLVPGTSASYDTAAPYYGMHVGLGYHLPVNADLMMDLNAKYIWSHQKGSNVNVSNQRFEFADADSHRARLGLRALQSFSKTVQAYVGGAYEHEFDAKFKARVEGMEIDSPSMDGGTGIGEVGLVVRPNPQRDLAIDFGVQAYTGKREGVTGSVQIKFGF